MDVSENDVFPLQNLPYSVQTRFIKTLPYFLQIELAQTNHYFLDFYKTHCFKRGFTEIVIIGVEEDGIAIKDKKYLTPLFEDKELTRAFLHQQTNFPTKMLWIVNPEKATAINIKNLAKELMLNGVYFTNADVRKKALNDIEKFSKGIVKKNTIIKEYLLGWDTLDRDDGTESLEKHLTFSVDALNGRRSTQVWRCLS